MIVFSNTPPLLALASISRCLRGCLRLLNFVLRFFAANFFSVDSHLEKGEGCVSGQGDVLDSHSRLPLTFALRFLRFFCGKPWSLSF